MMKKILLLLMVVMSGFVLIACAPTGEGELTTEEQAVLDDEMYRSFLYLWEQSNDNPESSGYGLTRDRYPGHPTIASIAAVGFALAALPVGVENGWITEEEGRMRAEGTLQTVLNLDHINGFYYHFLNIQTGAREWNSEISVIDTGILVVGAIVAAEYFGGVTAERMQSIYDRVRWDWYVDTNRNMFYMGYHPEQGFSGAWDHVSEQLMLYVLGSGASLHRTPKSMYDRMVDIMKTSYTGTYTSTTNSDLSVTTPFYYTYNGSLFQYQFSHAFVDFRNIEDENGINWFDNSVSATRASYAYAQDVAHLYKTYGPNAWGLTAGDGPGEYRAYGSRPAHNNTHNGTLAPYGAIASINYLPKQAAQAAVHYKTIDGLFSEYGFKDSYNLGPVDPLYNPHIEARTPWVAPDYIGIDKGITLLMLANYDSGIIWELFMQNSNVQDGLTRLGFTASQS